MIGQEGSWVVLIDIGDVQDAIATEDLELLQLEENAGLGLPTFILKFATTDERLTPYLNELSNIKLSFGRTTSDLKSCNVYPTEIHTGREGDARRHIELQGLLNYPDYLSSNIVGVTDKKSAVEALSDLAKRQKFTLGSDNISTSEDRQCWIQCNIPDKRFATHLWLHAKLSGSFPLAGISLLDETFRIRDAKKVVTGTPDWEFNLRLGSKTQSGGTQIAYHGRYTIRNSTGFVNSWVGYQREYLEYNAQTGDTKTLSFSITPMLSLASQMPTVGVQKRFGDVLMLPDCVDPDYNLTYQRNLAYLAQFSCFGVDLQFVNQFQPVKVCDLAYFREDSTDRPKTSASEYASGLYLVSRVTHVFTARRYTCSVRLTREAPGDIGGSA